MNIFSLNGRIGRLGYFGWMACLGVLYAIFKNIALNEYASMEVGVIGIMCVIILSVFPVVKRFHDINTSGWWSVAWCMLALVRVFSSIFLIDEIVIVVTMITFPLSLVMGIVLLFFKGTEGENKYGIRKNKPENKIHKENKISTVDINSTNTHIYSTKEINDGYVYDNNVKRKGSILVVISGIVSYILGLLGFVYSIMLLLERNILGFVPFIISVLLIFYVMKTNFGVAKRSNKENLNTDKRDKENSIQVKTKLQINGMKVYVCFSLVVIISLVVVVSIMNNKIDKIERRISNIRSWVYDINNDLDKVKSELDDVKSEVY